MSKRVRPVNWTSRVLNRPRPMAWVSTQEVNYHGRRIILQTGRGAVKLDAKEARELALELLAVAQETQNGNSE